MIEKGDPLTEGSVNPHDVLAIKRPAGGAGLPDPGSAARLPYAGC